MPIVLPNFLFSSRQRLISSCRRIPFSVAVLILEAKSESSISQQVAKPQLCQLQKNGSEGSQSSTLWLLCLVRSLVGTRSNHLSNSNATMDVLEPGVLGV